MYVLVPLMIETTLSRNPEILSFGGNPTSYVEADGRNNKPAVPPDWEP